MSAYWPEFLMVIVAHLVAVMSPGPDFALVLRQSVKHGRRTAVATSLGIGTGILFHVSYSLLGLGFVLQNSTLAFTIMKYAGAAYILWIGAQSLRTKPSTSLEIPPADAPATRSAFVSGLLVNLLNPKAALFFLAFFSVVVDPHTPWGVKSIYGLWMVVSTALWFTAISILFTRDNVRRFYLRIGHWIERGMGVVLIGFALHLVFFA